MVRKTDEVGTRVREGQPEWELLVPAAPGRILRTQAAPRVKTLDGQRVGLFWNLKPNGDAFLLRVGQLLKERFKDVSIVEFLPAKGDSAQGAPASAIRDAAAKCDLVILSTGD